MDLFGFSKTKKNNLPPMNRLLRFSLSFEITHHHPHNLWIDDLDA